MPRFLSETITNRGLVNEKLHDLGMIEDLIIDHNKNIQKLVVSSEDYLEEEVYAAIDYVPITYNAYGVIIDMGIEEFKNLSTYPYMQKKKMENPQ